MQRPNVYDLLVRRVGKALVGKRHDAQDNQDDSHHCRGFHIIASINRFIESDCRLHVPQTALGRQSVLRTNPPMSETRNRTRKIKNKILAILAAATAIPRNPNTAAIRATTKNASAQRSINPPCQLSRSRVSESNAGLRCSEPDCCSRSCVVGQYRQTGSEIAGSL